MIRRALSSPAAAAAAAASSESSQVLGEVEDLAEEVLEQSQAELDEAQRKIKEAKKKAAEAKKVVKVVQQAQKKKDQAKVDALKEQLKLDREKRKRGGAKDDDEEDDEPVEKRPREEEEDEGIPFGEAFAQDYLSETQLAYLTDELKAVDKDTYEIKMNEKTKQICKIGPKGRAMFSPLLLTMLIAQGVVRMPEAK